MQISIYSLLLATLALVANTSPAPDTSLFPRQEITSLPYEFTLDAFLFKDPSKTIPFGFPEDKVNARGLLGKTSKYTLKNGKIRPVHCDLEVGAPALRQAVELQPKGKGVPVRVYKEGNDTNIEVDDEKVLADFAITLGFVKGAPLALADRKPFVNPGLVKFRVIRVDY